MLRLYGCGITFIEYRLNTFDDADVCFVCACTMCNVQCERVDDAGIFICYSICWFFKIMDICAAPNCSP